MPASLEEALGLITGPVGAFAVALCGIAGVVVATMIDPVAAAVASAAMLVALVAVFIFALRQRSLYAGPYRIIEETIIWRLADANGRQAFLSKRQHVRFNHLAIAHIELASGDGERFASFICNYGTEIKRFPRDGEEGLLIALKPERTRDEEVEMTSQREIHDGFIGPDQWITCRFSAASKRTELVVEFPDDCQVRDVRVVGPTGHGSRPANDRELRTEGRRQVLRLKPRAYRENQAVKVTWSW